LHAFGVAFPITAAVLCQMELAVPYPPPFPDALVCVCVCIVFRLRSLKRNKAEPTLTALKGVSVTEANNCAPS
jgi:hypothetical protein